MNERERIKRGRSWKIAAGKAEVGEAKTREVRKTVSGAISQTNIGQTSLDQERSPGEITEAQAKEVI